MRPHALIAGAGHQPILLSGYQAIELTIQLRGPKVRADSATVDPQEIERFAAHAEAWWDPEGSFRPLHRLNPVRLDYIRQHLTVHFGRNISSL